MVPCATIEDVVKSVAFEDDMGLRATASTETEDYNRLLTLELVELRLDLIQWDIDCTGDTARGKFAGRADIDQECTVLDGLDECLIIGTREKTFDKFEHEKVMMFYRSDE